MCRAKKIIETGSKNKISLFCNVDQENVLSIPDVSNIYHVPLLLLQQNFHNLLSQKLNLKAIQDEKHAALPVEQQQQQLEGKKETMKSQEINIDKSLVKSWEEMVSRIDCATDDVSIALIGKYTNQQDSYLSVISALKHSCIATDQKLKLVMIESSDLEEEARVRDLAAYDAAWKALRQADGVLVPGTFLDLPTTLNTAPLKSISSPYPVLIPLPPSRLTINFLLIYLSRPSVTSSLFLGGFGVRGIEGKVEAVRYARENKVPFLGICLGIQAAVIEYARSFLDRPAANSREFEPSSSAEGKGHLQPSIHGCMHRIHLLHLSVHSES